MRKILFISFIILTSLSGYKAQLSIDLETGLCALGYNDVRISGKNGTLFSLTDDVQSKQVVFGRGRLNYAFGKRHSVSGLFAPLTIKGNGTLNEDVSFQDRIFLAGTKVNSVWKFNSYRLSYMYNLVLREKFVLGLGVTGKIRDAKISLSNSNIYSEKKNLGVVPLIRFYMNWNFAQKANLIIDGDALVGKQGRAEDVLLALGYSFTPQFTVKAGYRILEGGADNNEVYNFSLVHYGVIGVTYRFW